MNICKKLFACCIATEHDTDDEIFRLGRLHAKVFKRIDKGYKNINAHAVELEPQPKPQTVKPEQ